MIENRKVSVAKTIKTDARPEDRRVRTTQTACTRQPNRSCANLVILIKNCKTRH